MRGGKVKQHQNRPKRRAPHGHPLHQKQFGFWCTKQMHKEIMRRGGSAWVRQTLEEAMR